LLIVLSYIFFIFGNGLISLTNPDEVFYTLTAKEMVEQNSWSTPYLFGEPQFEKPIFTYWMIRLGFIMFGMTNFAARFFPAFFALIGVLAVYALSGLFFKNEKKAFISALVLMSSGLYVGLARTVFTDMIFSVFILLAILAFYWGYSVARRKKAGIILFFVCSALAVLTKGPLGFLIPAIAIVAFLIIKKDMKFLLDKSLIWGGLLFAAISFPWYILMINKYGTLFTHEFFYNVHFRRLIEAEHISKDTWYLYPSSMIGCMFPWSLFVLVSLIAVVKSKKWQNPVYLFLCCWIAVVFLIFQPAHSKLISYIFPLFPALAILAGDYIYNSIAAENNNRKFFRIAFASLAIFALIPIGLLGASFSSLNSYLSSKAPFYIGAAVFSTAIIFAFYYLLRYKFYRVVYLFTVMLFLFLSILALVRNDIEPYISSKYICDYLSGNYNVNNTILASKFYARGVRFYTGKDVAVIDIPGKPYFSPHPVLFLNKDDLAWDFLSKQGTTYCILKKSSVEDIQRITGGKLKYSVLKQMGDEYLVRVEPRG